MCTIRIHQMQKMGNQITTNPSKKTGTFHCSFSITFLSNEILYSPSEILNNKNYTTSEYDSQEDIATIPQRKIFTYFSVKISQKKQMMKKIYQVVYQFLHPCIKYGNLLI